MLRPAKDSRTSRARAAGLLGYVVSACVLAVGELALERAALAQPSAPSAEVAVTPPVPTSSQAVDYPQGASGDATVTLTLVVDKEGHVTRVSAAEEPSAFTRAAETAALTWTYEPAKRGAVPVSSRIRTEVIFKAPAPPPPEVPAKEPMPAGAASASASTTNARPVAPAPAPVEQVEVHGARGEPSRSASLTRAEVRQLPGAFGDPFRAIDALPGVTPIASGVPFFYIRGAPPGNVGYFIDGVKVPYLFHVALGPSVIHPAIVERVDLYPGGYPASFGRFTGGIVSGELAPPRTDFHGEANVRLVDAGALVETGFADGKGTVLVGGRYSYTAALVSLFASDTELGYRDYQARVSYDVTPKDRLTLTSFGAFDILGQTQADVRNILFASEFYRVDTRWEHTFDSRTKARTSLTFGFDQTRVPAQPRNSRNLLGSARTEIVHEVSDDVHLRTGADVLLEGYSVDERPYSDPDDPLTKRFNALFPARTDVTAGVRGDVVLRLGRLEITPGVRFDLFHSGTSTVPAVDPRASSRVSVTDTFRIVQAFGLVHQPPSYLIPIPGLAVGNLTGGLQSSVQSSAGIEVDLPSEITASITGFQNIFHDMSDTLGVSERDPFDLDYREPRSEGRAIGLEVYVRRRLTKRVSGYVTYTLSRSTRTIGREKFMSAFDRTHVANAALAVDLGRNWRAGMRFTFYTGVPVIAAGGGPGNALIAPPRSLDPERDPSFYRFDFRLEKKWNVGKKGWISFVMEMLNATLHKETVQGQEIGPISIPSIGVEGGL